MTSSSRALGFVVVVLTVLTMLLVVNAAPAGAASPRIDLRVLVVTDGQPESEALQESLIEGGVPIDVVDVAERERPRLTAAALRIPDEAPHARYQAVVLPTGDTGPPGGLDAGELAAVHDLEREFGLRQLSAVGRPTPSGGPDQRPRPAAWAGELNGAVGRLTPAAGQVGFGDMHGEVPLGTDVWGEFGVARPDYVPLLTATSPDGRHEGSIAGVHTADGREELALSFSFEPGSPAIGALAPGLIEWLTKGTHLGVRRSYLAVHVDDVLLPDARWVVGSHCAFGADCPPGVPPVPTIRMSAADADAAAAWSRGQRFRLDLAFNGAGSAAAAPDGNDPLLGALAANRDAFRFVNHTWSHEYLGCVRDSSVVPWRCATVPVLGWTRFVPSWEIDEQITRNIAFGRTHGIPVDPTELVTGEHSGLRGDDEMPADNPELAGVLDDDGIRTVASDASKEPAQRPLGNALTVPRHPIDLDYDTATFRETVDQYNWSHTSRADGGEGACEVDGGCLAPVDATDPAVGFTRQIVPTEAAKVLDHVLGNDPRPHYVHQPQLTGDRTLYPVLDAVLTDFRALYTDARPLLDPTMTQSRDELARQAEWVARAPRTRAWTQDGEVHVATPEPVSVPLTVPAGNRFGDAYGTGRSGWVAVNGEQQITGGAQ